ncbi:glycosyltransferase [Pseudooceanicola sp. 200-1SW]|uniref:glycosyltransferase family 2 protein n=1 Tax=Pseudooceanicola sp. 200-1SW TaxID=3425949 RepID=UPI003D7F2595
MPQTPPVFHAFGQSAALETGGDGFLEADSRWRLAQIHEAALAQWALPARGHALDVGAGFGAFALLFALAWPGWRVSCFEPDEAAYGALCRNIARLGLGDRVGARRAAILPGAEGGTGPLRRDRKRPAFLAADRPPWREGYRAETFPALPPERLAATDATLLRLTAPGVEEAVLTAFGDALPRFVLGECWGDPPPSALATGGGTQIYLPLAGSAWQLRDPGQGAHPPGLDIVVAMYNSAQTIVDCLDSLRRDPAPDQHIWVVDDGSTDDSVARIRAAFGADPPGMTLLCKPNGGCASARNWGRMHSGAAHLAFVDADDMVDPGFYAGLLELARYSGQGVVQGSFQPFRDSDRGRIWLPRPEAEGLAHLPRRPFGPAQVCDIPWPEIVTGQPSIWRRIYRRDFLDGHDIWFPEHIRAFDDQIFQIVSGYHAGHVPARDDLRYLYRQHPGQDIAQGDARALYSLEMYRLILRRAVAEGWSDFRPVAASFFNTLEWSYRGLRPDLAEDLGPALLRGAAELWVYMLKVFGPDLEGAGRPGDLPDLFAQTAARLSRQLDGVGNSYVFAYLDAPQMHVDMVRAALPA